jgi:hypothetical protein
VRSFSPDQRLKVKAATAHLFAGHGRPGDAAPDAMSEFGVIGKRYDIADMIQPKSGQIR